MLRFFLKINKLFSLASTFLIEWSIKKDSIQFSDLLPHLLL